jgi:hypothetical protein
MDRTTKSLKSSLSALEDTRVERIEIAPKLEDQQEVFYRVLKRAEEQKGWTIYIDEGKRFDELGLMPELEHLATQARSLKISLAVGTQRPAWVSRYLLSEPSHHISGYHDGRDRKTLRDCVSESHYEALGRLQRFQFAWTSDMPPRTWVGSLQDLQSRPALRVVA